MTARVLLLFLLALSGSAAPVRIAVAPKNPLLFGKAARQKLAVTAYFAGGSSLDVTAASQFASANGKVAAVRDGIIIALANGASTIHVSYAGLTASTIALVQQADAPMPLSFSGDIMPVLTKLGCNGGSCHGALNGQNGFKLSLFGYDPDADYEMIARLHDGRRLDRQHPEKSLLLAKPAFEVPHGGGKLLRKGSADYQALMDWIAGGALQDAARERRITALRVLPASHVLYGKDSKNRLLVTAKYSDGTEGDVTHLVGFASNDDSIVKVSPSGELTALRGGETSIVVRGPGVTAGATVGVVQEKREFPPMAEMNFIDRHIQSKLRALSIPPSEPCDDATFLRRAFLDIIGIIPTAAEARRYLEDPSPDKRARLVGDLLRRPEYADYWAVYWGDHLSNTRQLLYNKGPYTFTQWLYKAFRSNMPYDEFARQLLASSGNMYGSPATSFYPLMRKSLDLAAMTSQLFLGVSIECARCHNHPLEKWTQDDFNGMAAFFSQVRYKGAGPRNNERVLYVDFEREFQHPDTKKAYWPKPLGGPVMAIPAMENGEYVDRREALARWLTSSENPYFARAIVNRMWRNFMGRGFVEPVDDFRVTNPPTNEPLLEELARDFTAHGYDLHHLIRRITASSTYQLSSAPNRWNKVDTMAYSRYYPKRLSAEQLLDSVSLATGVPEEYKSLYPGTRAMQVPDPEIESYFLEVFDRPSRQLICERKNAPTLNQALHLVSGESLQKKISGDKGVLRKLLAARRSTVEIVEELYLGTVSRLPDAAERKLAEEAVRKAGDTGKGLEDVFWALLSSKEFLFNH